MKLQDFPFLQVAKSLGIVKPQVFCHDVAVRILDILEQDGLANEFPAKFAPVVLIEYTSKVGFLAVVPRFSIHTRVCYPSPVVQE